MRNDLDKELALLAKVLPSIVRWKKDKDGILIQPEGHPSGARVVKMPPEIRDKVWDWLHNPKLFEDAEEYKQLRVHLLEVLLTVMKTIFDYADPLHQKLVRKAVEKLAER